MKPDTYVNTVLLVRAFLGGKLKEYLVDSHMAPVCARVRIMRFKREYSDDYARLKHQVINEIKCNILLLANKRESIYTNIDGRKLRQSKSPNRSRKGSSTSPRN